jgi:hypothetical protein
MNRSRQEFKSSLGNIARPLHKKKNNNKKQPRKIEAESKSKKGRNIYFEILQITVYF